MSGDEREIARQRVDILRRWLHLNELKLVNAETGQVPDLLSYRLEDLMLELGEIGDR
jgi:hypothetical protein